MAEGHGAANRVLRILVVDDNRDGADSLAEVLRLWGYSARVAYDGPSALAAAREYAPDCLITDIAMPDMDGCKLVAQLRRLPGMDRTKLVALSAYSDASHYRRTREAGFHYSLRKPAEFGELRGMLTMMEQVLDLAKQTEKMSRKNVDLAQETKSLMEDVKKDIKEVIEDVRELKDEIRDALDRPKDDPPA